MLSELHLQKVLLVIIVTANSNKWQQALGFVSCAQLSMGLATQKAFKKKPFADQPEIEYEHICTLYVQIQVHRLWHFFLAAITNTKVYQKKTLHVLQSK